MPNVTPKQRIVMCQLILLKLLPRQNLFFSAVSCKVIINGKRSERRFYRSPVTIKFTGENYLARFLLGFGRNHGGGQGIWGQWNCLEFFVCSLQFLLTLRLEISNSLLTET